VSSHEWRVLLQYRLTDDEARGLVEGYGHPEVDHAPDRLLAAGERPAVGDPRVWLGPHNQLRDETAVVCWSCEQGWTAEIAAKPCPGPDGSPLGDLAGGLSGAPPLGNTRAGMTAVGRNDPCPCGSGQKFKRCHGA
jgi:hypothetical protein